MVVLHLSRTGCQHQNTIGIERGGDRDTWQCAESAEKQITMQQFIETDRMARNAIQWRGSVPLAFKAAGLMVPEPSFILPIPFKAFVGWREGGYMDISRRQD